MSVGSAPIEYMFEETSDGVLIDVMGEATRDESTASAQWMLAVVNYMPGALRSCLRLSGGAAIPRMRWPRRYRRRRTSARAVGQIHYGRTLLGARGGEVAPDPGYRPRAETLEFIRWRDLTCRWPGCHRPVDKSDIDHTVPWAYGPTHPSNNKPYCRTQRLHKRLTAGEMNFAETHRYGDATAKRRHSPGTPLSS